MNPLLSSYVFAVTLLLFCGSPLYSFDQDKSSASPKEESASETPANHGNKNKKKALWGSAKEIGGKALESGKEGIESATRELDSTRANRARSHHHILGTYSLIDTWIPSKLGANYAYNLSANFSSEVEYLRGIIAVPFIIDDLGKISDQRLSLLFRSYSDRNSFSFLYGVSYNFFRAHLGNEFLSTISSGNVSQFDIVSMQTIALSWGLGNRWHFKNRLIIGLDWFTINLPIVVLDSNADFLSANASAQKKEEIRDVLDIIERIPTFSVLKFQVGISY